MSEPIDTDALIIGAGPAGLFQAFQLGLLEISFRIVDALPHAGGQCVQLYGDKPIFDIPGTPRTTGRGLVQSLLEQLQPFRPSLHLGTQVLSLQRETDGRWLCGTSSGEAFRARCVFIAAGVGAFVPKKLALPGIEAREGRELWYHPESPEPFAGRAVAVIGGDDAAVQTALELAGCARRVTLVHRRDAFQADDRLLDALRRARDEGRIGVAIGQPQAFDGHTLQLATPEGGTLDVEADALAVCLGISPRLGPVADWGLALTKKQLVVDAERFQTSEAGIFAIGDVNTYPGKKKLIVCAFHEATLAAWAATAIVFPGKPIPLQYTTTSTRLHTLLGLRSD